MWKQIEKYSWEFIDAGINGLINIAIMLPIYWWINARYHPSPVILIVLFFVLSLIIGLTIAKGLNLHIGYWMKGKYLIWLQKKIDAMRTKK